MIRKNLFHLIVIGFIGFLIFGTVSFLTFIKGIYNQTANGAIEVGWPYKYFNSFYMRDGNELAWHHSSRYENALLDGVFSLFIATLLYLLYIYIIDKLNTNKD